MSEGNSEPKVLTAGAKFQVIAPSYVSLADVRRMVEEDACFKVHIRASFGPTEIVPTDEDEGTQLICPVNVVDDLSLSGICANVPIPNVGYVLYIGYLKGAEEGTGD